MATEFAPVHGASKQQDRRPTQSGGSSALFVALTPHHLWVTEEHACAGWWGEGCQNVINPRLP